MQNITQPCLLPIDACYINEQFEIVFDEYKWCNKAFARNQFYLCKVTVAIRPSVFSLINGLNECISPDALIFFA